MRRRLLWSTLAAAGLAVVLLGVPLAVAVRVLFTQQALSTLQQEAERNQVVLNQQSLTLQMASGLLDQFAANSEARFVLFDEGPFGRVAIDTGAPPEIPQEVATALGEAPQGEVGRAAFAGVVAVSVPLQVQGVRQLLVAIQPDDELRGDIRGAWFAIAGLGALALAAAAGVATAQGRRLARPLEELAGSARKLGDGDFTQRAPRSGLPEADDVAVALDATAGRLGAMLERSRSFGADASHQLRTPLTALRLDLEALEASGASDELMAAAHAEVDRLEATIDELLALAAAPAGDEWVDVVAVVASRLDAWRSLAGAAGREVRLDALPVPPVRVRAAALGQSVQVLLDNALTHGDGPITVSVRGYGAASDGVVRPAQWVRVCVADEGDGVPPATEASLGGAGDHAAPSAPDPDAGAVPAGAIGNGQSGRGLALARSLVEAEGGRLHLERARPGAVFCILLPVAREALAVPPPPA